jgi:hypothetical protein
MVSGVRAARFSGEMGISKLKLVLRWRLKGLMVAIVYLIVLVAPAFFGLNVFSPKKNRF